jgi:hypothetical protein
MLGQSERRDILARRPWLLAIGQWLRAEYSAAEQPVPERLAALIAQLEGPAKGQGSEKLPAWPSVHQVPPHCDTDKPVDAATCFPSPGAATAPIDIASFGRKAGETIEEPQGPLAVAVAEINTAEPGTVLAPAR